MYDFNAPFDLARKSKSLDDFLQNYLKRDGLPRKVNELTFAYQNELDEQGFVLLDTTDTKGYLPVAYFGANWRREFRWDDLAEIVINYNGPRYRKRYDARLKVYDQGGLIMIDVCCFDNHALNACISAGIAAGLFEFEDCVGLTCGTIIRFLT